MSAGGVALVLLVMSPVVVLLAVARNQRRRSETRSATVELDVGPLGVRRLLADGREERVDWDEVTEVEVLTARSGPHAAAGGVVILAGDQERGALVPLDRLGEPGLVELLARLPGFDVDRLVRATEARPPTRTLCWHRPGLAAADGAAEPG